MRSIVLAILLLLHPLTYLIPPIVGIVILCRIAYHLQ